MLVLGATRGLGRGVAEVLVARNAAVTGVGRDREAVGELAEAGVAGRVGDVTDPTRVGGWLDEVRPSVVVLVAGAAPLMRPLSQYSWEALSAPWETDVKATFHLLQAALHGALGAGGHVVIFSSGAAMQAGGSPLSGGYAGAKQTQRFLCRYAAQEAAEREIDLRIHCVLPQLNPNTALGAAGVAAYARKAGITPAEFVAKRFGDRPLSPAIAGEAVAGLLAGEHSDAKELVLSGQGLSALG